jgi:serine/threonine protein kinase
MPPAADWDPTDPPPHPAPAPVPNNVSVQYQFRKRLGQTPHTEVWEVQASDGRRRLAKVLFGHAGADPAAVQRLLALRHPALVPFDLVKNTPGQLVLACDPPEKTLRDCLQECQARKLAGVPRDQLLGYLWEAATALTELQRQHDLQHLGLNPRTLSLNGGRILLADFGLAQLLWWPTGGAVARMNPRYSAPELFRRERSPSCDQYSLALIYHELLTGQLPVFPGKGASLADLSELPEADQPTIARALDPSPEKRFETCVDLMRALGVEKSAVPHATFVPVPIVAEASTNETIEITHDATGTLAAVKRMPSRAAPATPWNTNDLISDTDSWPRPPVKPRPEAAGPPTAPVSEVGDLDMPSEVEHTVPLSRPTSASKSSPVFPPVPTILDLPPARTVLEDRFGVNLSASTILYLLDGLRRRWNGREVRTCEANLVFRLKPPRSFWKRQAGNLTHLEVHVQLATAPPLMQAVTEVVVAILAVESGEERVGRPAKTVGHMLLSNIHTALQVNAKGRGHQRMHWPHPVRLWPIEPGGRLGDPIDCQGKDLALNGIGLYAPREVTTKEVRLQLPLTDQTPAMTVPARVVRVKDNGDGWYEVGAILLSR